jgi:hypothetical protein
MKLIATLLVLVSASAGAGSQSAHDDMNRRGALVMGFSHEKAVHHFRLHPDGGAIEVAANDAADTMTAAVIRKHLTHIAAMFADGNFNAPFLIHRQDPPGADMMSKLKSRISYTFEAMPSGGRVRIATVDGDAVRAVHEFLRFQITEHKTGDPLRVGR